VLTKIIKARAHSASDSWRGSVGGNNDLPHELAVRARGYLPRGGLLPARGWRRRHQGILILLWLHVLGFLAFVVQDQEGWSWHTGSEVAVIALLAALATWQRPGRTARTALASLGLIASSALLVHISGGLIEMHFHFFAALAVIALYEDWLPFLLSVGYVVFDHGVVGVLQPELIYNHADAIANPWKWAVIHAAFVVAASTASIIHWRLSETERVRATSAQGQRVREQAAREAAEAELRVEQAALVARRQSEERFRALAHNTADLITIVAADGVLTYQSPAAELVWGYLPAALEGVDVLGLVHPDDESGAQAFLAEVYRQPGTNLTTELRLRRADGSWRACEVVGNNLLNEPSVSGVVVTWRDVTARKDFEEQLTRMAFHDSLTGLANRALMTDRLQQALARAERQFGRLALLFLDLDNFKTINDSLGHDAGDELLIAVAARLRACLRGEDTAARLGGDEFTILLEEVSDSAEAVAAAERITTAFSNPFCLRGRDVYVTASVGVAVSQTRGASAEALLRSADLALYRAKASGKACLALYEPGMEANALDRLELETDLRHAVERQEFRLEYQPIFSILDGRLTEVEALVRWQHPTRGLLAPAVFIPLAEENGLILPIGRWVLEEACRQARLWQDSFTEGPPPIMDVNLSARQFQQPDLVSEIIRILDATGLEARNLKLEITESVLMDDADASLKTMQALRSLGIRLAVDDFGTGYSSLSYLQRFPVDTLKIDRSFVNALGRDPQSRAIVQSVVLLAKTLGLDVTGEGVETTAQEAELRFLGCDQGQGFLFARPVPVDVLEAMLSGHRARQTPRLAA
jgi:diguanylate cyclase (GGDEF)-like protein/PAS domain S-box-containing protein